MNHICCVYSKYDAAGLYTGGLNSSPDELMIPWHHTTNMSKAQDTLNSMFNHFNADSIVKTYLESNCAHLLLAPEGNTGIPQSYFNVDNWTPELKQRLTPSYTTDTTRSTSVSISTLQPAFAIGSPSSIKAYQRYSRYSGCPYWIRAPHVSNWYTTRRSGLRTLYADS